MKYQMATVVVTAAVATALRDLAFRLDKGDMAGMFTVGLSATGAAPATHFISSGCVSKPLVVLLRDPVLMFTTASAAFAADSQAFPYTQLQVTAALAQCTLSAGASNTETPLPQTPLAVIAGLGLQVIATGP